MTQNDYFLESNFTIKGEKATDSFNMAFAVVNRDDFDFVLDPSYGSVKLVAQQRYFGQLVYNDIATRPCTPGELGISADTNP